MQRRHGDGEPAKAVAPVNVAWRDQVLQHLEPLTRRPLLLVLIAMTAIVLGQAVQKHGTGPGSADRASVIVARVLYGGTGDVTSAAGPQLRPPGYPLVLTAMAIIDPGVARGLACAGELPDGCEKGFPFLSVVVLQTIAAILALFLVYRLAWRLSGSQSVAIITLLLAFVFGRFADFAGNIFGHTFYQLGVVASLYLLVPAGEHLSPRRAALAGLVAGLTVLFEPTFVFIVPIAALLLVNSAATQSRAAVVFVATSLVAVLGPVALATAFGYDPQAIARHMTWNLAERAAFNQLHGATWWAAILVPIPVFGPVFGLLFPDAVINSFGYYTPGTFVFDGTTRILPRAFAQPGSAWHQLFWLFRTYIVGEPVAYLNSSVALVMRGLWAGSSLLALVGIVQVWPMLQWARIGPRAHATLLVVTLSAAMLLAGTLLTSNPMYLNPMLIFVYAFAVAYLAGGR